MRPSKTPLRGLFGLRSATNLSYLARFFAAGALFAGVALFTGVVAPVPVEAATTKARNSASARSDGFMSEGRFVRVDVVRARYATMPAPAVIILHGAHGLGDGSLFYPQAEALADAGINAFVVHYFDGIGMSAPTRSKAAKGSKSAKRSSGGAASPALHWARDRVIGDAIDYVAARRDVDGARIGVFGLSLGGFHALGIGARDQRVHAVVNVVGAMPSLVARSGVNRMPPTLILHGDQDRTVSPRKAYELAALLKELGTPHELHMYKGQGHAFRGEARTDSFRRTVAFFSAQFKKGEPEGSVLAVAAAEKPAPATTMISNELFVGEVPTPAATPTQAAAPALPANSTNLAAANLAPTNLASGPAQFGNAIAAKMKSGFDPMSEYPQDFE